MLPSSIKLRHLNTFIEVARHRSVARAAEALHVSQPAVTKTVRELEQSLGIGLVEREGRGIRITHDGEIFLQHAISALSALQHGVRSVSRDGSKAAPPLRVGALPTVSSRIMPLAMELFLRDDRSGRVEVSTGDNDRLLEQLRLGELDLVVGRLAAPDRMTGLTFEHLYSEKVVFVVQPRHPLLALSPFRLEALQSFPVLMPTRRSIIRQPVEQFLIARGLDEVRSRVETVSDSFGREFVKRTDAVWIISEGVVDADVLDGQLAILPIDTAETQGPVGLTMVVDVSPALHLPPLLQAIRRAVRNRLDRSSSTPGGSAVSP